MKTETENINNQQTNCRFCDVIRRVDIEPYYQEDGIILYNADCSSVLPLLQAKSIDLVLTDPPYNGGLDYGETTNDSMDWEEYVLWLDNILLQCEEVCRGMVISFISKPGLIKMIKHRSPWWIGQWVGGGANPAGPNNGVMFSPRYEPYMFYGNRYSEKICIPDVYQCSQESDRNGHPCPKPLKLISRMLNDLTDKLILDPFSGSGTTLVAAKRLNRSAIGIEISEKFCEITSNRLRQGELFNQHGV